MMIFQHTVDKVLSGEKTQTRRLVKTGDGFTFALSVGIVGPYAGHVVHTVPNYGKPVAKMKPIYSVCNGKRTVYAVGKTYATQPGRGQKAVGRIRLTGIRAEDVREISDDDVKAEGFHDTFHFLWTWTKMHDKPAWNANQNTDFSDGDESGWRSHSSEWISWLKGTRPAERYQAWVLEFELVADNGA